GLATRAAGEITAMDFAAVMAAPGVIGVLTAADIPGENDVSSPHKHDDPVFAEGQVQFHGQPIFAVVGTTREAARRAARLARIDYRDGAPLLDLDKAIAAGAKLVTGPLTLQRGDVEAGLAGAERRIEGRIVIGGQEH